MGSARPPRTSFATRAIAAAIVIAIMGAIMGAGACAPQTAVRVRVTTKIPCAELKGVTLSVGVGPQDTESRYPQAITRECHDGVIGDLFVGPSLDASKGDRAGVRVTAGYGREVEDCAAPDYADCVVSRRSFVFRAGETVTLPIELVRPCVGVGCTTTTTCVRGRCVGAAVDTSACNRESCTLPEEATEDGGPEGTTDGPVGPTGDDASLAARSDARSDASFDARTDAATGGDPCAMLPSAWPFSGRCPSRTGFGTGSLLPTTPSSWGITLSDNSSQPPVIAADGSILLADTIRLWSVDRTSNEQWHVDAMPGNFTTAPAVGLDGSIWIGDNGGNLRHYSALGAAQPSLTLRSAPLGGSPVISRDGTLYVADGGANPVLHAVATVGTVRSLWMYATNGVGTESAAIGSDGVVFVTAGGALNAVLPNGQRKWRITLPSGAATSPAIGTGGRVHVGVGGACYAFDPETGAQVWGAPISETGDVILAPPAIGPNGDVYVAVGASLTRLDAAGQVVRTFVAPSGFARYFAPVVTREGGAYMVFGTTLYAIDASGQSPWSFVVGNASQGDPITSGAIAPDGSLYVVVNSHSQGKAYAFYP